MVERKFNEIISAIGGTAGLVFKQVENYFFVEKNFSGYPAHKSGLKEYYSYKQ